MDQTSVLVACISIIATSVFITKYLVPLARPEKEVVEDEVEKVIYDEDEDEDDDDDDEDVDEDDDEDEVKNEVEYDDMPALDSGEVTDDEMPPLIPVDMPALEVCEYVTKEEFDTETLKNSKAILAKIDEYHDAMAKALDDKYNDILSKTIDDKIDNLRKEITSSVDDKIDHLRKELNSSVEIDILDSSIQLEEKILKNIKEWFIPLHAKKELDKLNYQGWKGEAELDTSSLEIVIKNTSNSTYEENDAWVDVTNNSDDSIKYRDSLLGLHDSSSWTYNLNEAKTNASLTKRYVTLGWNNSVSITVVIKNMPIAPRSGDQDIKTQAMDKLKKFQIKWKRVLHTNSA